MIQKLISRLVPFSKQLQGTEMGIRYEKKKLMAMLPSPIIEKQGHWRYFITFAPADLYENRLYEIVIKTDNENFTWKERNEKVKYTIIQ